MQEHIIHSTKPKEIQKQLNNAPSGAVIRFPSNTHKIKLSEPLEIKQKNITLLGFKAKVAKKKKSHPLLLVKGDNFVLKHFDLEGNRDYDGKREALVIVTGEKFTIAHGKVSNSSKDGILISAESGTVDGGKIYDIVGKNNGRDTVSIEGHGDHHHWTQNILVKRIKTTGSKYRGAVEVSDGSRDITVRNVQAKDCLYAIDIQDHGHKNQKNNRISISNIQANKCDHVVRTANHDLGHSDLLLSNITAKDCKDYAFALSNTKKLVLENIIISDDRKDSKERLEIKNCKGIQFKGTCKVNGKDLNKKHCKVKK